ncbi:unnamed protein product, partial [Menidia menidia]
MESNFSIPEPDNVPVTFDRYEWHFQEASLKSMLKPFRMCKVSHLPGLPLFNDPRVLNTAMTRAQSQVIVVGDAAALCCFGKCSGIWKSFMDHCITNKNVVPQHYTKDFFEKDVMEIARFQKTEVVDETETVNDAILQELRDEYEKSNTESSSDEDNVEELNPQRHRGNEDQTDLLDLCSKQPKMFERGKFVRQSYSTGYVVPFHGSNRRISIQGRTNTGKAFTGDEVVIQIQEPRVVGIVKSAKKVRQIRMALPRSLSEVNVETISNVQGKQFRAVIITAVQTRDSLQESHLPGLPLFNDPRVLNTAMTRAQSQVIVVGDAAALCCFGKCSGIWKSFMDHCIANKNVVPQHYTKDFFEKDVMEIAKFQKTEVVDETETVNDAILQELRDEYEKSGTESSSDEDNVEELNPQRHRGNVDQTDLLDLCSKHPKMFERGKFVRQSYSTGYVVPFHGSNRRISIQGRTNTGKAFTGDEVVIQIQEPRVVGIVKSAKKVIGWKKHCFYPLGNVIDILPKTGYSGDRLWLLKEEFGVSPTPPETDGLSSEEEDTTDRRDERKTITFTVDPAVAKDLDDAISIREDGEYYELGIHISDVASFVEPGGTLDEIAGERGCSFYGKGEEPIHMFPKEQSTELFSLLPGRDRRVVSLMFKVRKDTDEVEGKPRFQLSLINSNRKLSYEQAEDIISKRYRGPPSFGEVEDCVTVAYRFAKAQRKRRLPEWAYSQCDDKRLPGRRKARVMIEEMSVLFNRHTSKTLLHSPLTENLTPLQCHAKPDDEKVEYLKEKLGELIPLSFHVRHKVDVDQHTPSIQHFRIFTKVWEDILSAARADDMDKMIFNFFIIRFGVTLEGNEMLADRISSHMLIFNFLIIRFGLTAEGSEVLGSEEDRVEIAKMLVEDAGVDEGSIVVLSPYNAQRGTEEDEIGENYSYNDHKKPRRVNSQSISSPMNILNSAMFPEQVEIAKMLVKDAGVDEGSIVVLSPYNAQVSAIREELKRMKLGKITVTTITKSQEIVSEPSGVWLSKHVGFVADPNQINVAITRAKEGLCIIEIVSEPSGVWLSKHVGFVADPNQINVAITRAKEGLCIIEYGPHVKVQHQPLFVQACVDGCEGDSDGVGTCSPDAYTQGAGLVSPRLNEAPGSSFSSATPESCEYGNNCPKAHSEEELKEWMMRAEEEVEIRSSMEAQGLMCYNQRLLDDISCDEALNAQCDDTNTTLTWNFRVETERELVHVALLKEEPGASFSLGDSSPAPCVYASGEQVPREEITYSITVTFTSVHAGLYEQWLVLDFDMRPVLLKKLKVRVGQPPSDDSEQSSSDQRASVQSAERWHRGNRIIIPCSSRTEEQEMLKLYKPPLVGLVHRSAHNKETPLTRDNYREKMHRFLYDEERAEDQVVS